jgi:hypothetical protein
MYLFLAAMIRIMQREAIPMAQKSKPRSAAQNTELCYQPLDAERCKLKEELLSAPVKPVTISQNMHVSDLIKAMSGMSIQARNLGRCQA